MICKKCRAVNDNGSKFCISCGNALINDNIQNSQVQENSYNNNETQGYENNLNMTQNQGYNSEYQNNNFQGNANMGKSDVEEGKHIAILSYIFPFVTYFIKTNSVFARYHAIRGFNYFILTIIYFVTTVILSSFIKVEKCVWYVCTNVTPRWLATIISLGSLVVVALYIIGICYAATGKKKELPIVGKIQIIKK
ncbi:MAG: hypothetical protein ACK5HL_00245 [Bacilli bacterium]